MRKFTKKLILMCFAITLAGRTMAQIPAFPGAGGGGAQSVGGRGGIVYEVTNLNDTGTGSLRAGVEMSGARTIVFRVGGTIQITSGFNITNPYITIAGQTAPGGGIQIDARNTKESMFSVYTHDIIIRYLRLRHGYNAAANQTGDPVSVMAGNNIIIDHCTLMWTTDENADAWGRNVTDSLRNLTWSWNIFAEPLKAHPTNFITGSNKPDVAESMTDIDLHHNLMANSSHRSPLIKNKIFRFVNNIVYNWKMRASHTSGGVKVDFIGNLYKKGPESSFNSTHEISVFPDEADKWTTEPPGPPSIYVLGNKGHFNTYPSNDNWSMVWEIADNENGYTSGSPTDVGQLSITYRRTTPLPALPIPITVDPADNLEALILSTVGASQRLDCLGNWVLNRDATDTRIISEYNSGTGIIPKTEDDVGGFLVIAGGTPCTDTDHDGMPNEWEKAHGLNPTNSADGNGTTIMNPYTNPEAYLSGLYGYSPGISETKPNFDNKFISCKSR